MARIHHDNLILVDKMRQIALSNNHNPALGSKTIRRRKSKKQTVTAGSSRYTKAHQQKLLLADNERILERIVSTRSVYNTKRWGQEAKKTHKLISNISRYPYQNDKWGSSTSRRPNTSRSSTRKSRSSRSSSVSSSRAAHAPNPKSTKMLQKHYRQQNSQQRPASRAGKGSSTARRPNGRSSSRIFNKMVMIHNTECHVRVLERQRPSRLDIKTYVSDTQLEYVLSLPLVQLKQCFPGDRGLFALRNREALVTKLLAHLVFVEDEEGYGEVNLELCVDLSTGQSKPVDEETGLAEPSPPPAPVEEEEDEETEKQPEEAKQEHLQDPEEEDDEMPDYAALVSTRADDSDVEDQQVNAVY
jgi:hypothetical protein